MNIEEKILNKLFALGFVRDYISRISKTSKPYRFVNMAKSIIIMIDIPILKHQIKNKTDKKLIWITFMFLENNKKTENKYYLIPVSYVLDSFIEETLFRRLL